MSNNDFREIVEDSKIEEKDTSTQEVIVEETDDDGYEGICYICNRPERVAGKMIRIPGNICICNDCMQRTFDTMNYGGFPMDGYMLSPDMMMAEMEAAEGEDESEKEGKEKKSGKRLGKIPTISMINLADLQGFGMPHAQKIKKKKPDEKREPVIDIHNIPAPHKIKASLDERSEEHTSELQSPQ